ncbi:MAG: hydantoinase/oxoprolinase family protein [Deltaproteobacteria bacterium]|nr:hydantoinase/oxoprolinase family protein [Deltaproteobacteria bacterium]
MYRVGIDIGGTFTDLIMVDEATGERFISKVLTTPKDPSVGAMQGLRELLEARGIQGADVTHVIHGTTLVANSLIERKGAKTGLVTTRGFRDILEMGREKRYDIYDLFLEMPEPLVPRPLRMEVTERLLADGTLRTPLDEREAHEAAETLAAEGVESVAVSFLHSYRNPAHERRMREILEEVAPHLFISLSVEVIPELREYERLSTTASNAYVMPLMRRYLQKLREELQALGYTRELYLMLSGGGITTSAEAERFPVRIVESGPAAGALVSAAYGEVMGVKDIVLSFDMGGTTAKICVIREGRPLVTTDFEVAAVWRFKKGSGLPIKLPVIDMIEIGAGGGSIARRDDMGLLKVGPQSAGSDPGPACYGLGGSEPTVTDADLVLGYLDAQYFLGGKMPLQVGYAREAIGRLAEQLGVTPEKAAWGIYQVVGENMANAARVHAVERGQDPKGYSMVAFGGAGPVHAYWVASRLGVQRVIAPFGAGVASAGGFLIVPLSFDFVRSHVARLAELDLDAVNRLYQEMEEEGTRILTRAGVRKRDLTYIRTCDMRYVGQGHEVNVPVPRGTLSGKSLLAIRRHFERLYKKLFHRINPEYEIEALSWRLVVTAPKPEFRLLRFPARPDSRVEDALKGTRQVYFPEPDGYVDCRVFDRYRLFEGAEIEGPAVIEERESTVVVGPRARVVADPYLNLLMSIRR